MIKKIGLLVTVFGVMALFSLVGLISFGRTVVAAPEATGIIKGQLIAEDGGAVGKVIIYASPTDSTTTADANGFYTFTLPVNPDGYDLYAGPVPGESYLLGKSFLTLTSLGRIVVQDGEVRAGINLTLSVGGVLAGTLLDAETKLPLTTHGFVFANATTGIEESMEVVRGVLNPERAAMRTGKYQPTNFTIELRKTTTVTVLHNDNSLMQSVLSIPGMPNVIGLQFQDLRKPMLYSVDYGRTWRSVWQPSDYLGNDNTLGGKNWGAALTRRGPADASLRVLLALGNPAESWDEPLVRTGNNGETWTDASVAPKACAEPTSTENLVEAPTSGVLSIVSLGLSPRDAKRLYAVGLCRQNRGPYFLNYYLFFVSDDYGLTWQRREAFPTAGIGVWAPSLTEDNRMFSFRYNVNGPFIAESNDAGQTWITQTLSLTSYMGSPLSLAADGVLTNTLYQTTYTHDTDFNYHLWSSSNAGVTWSEAAHPCNRRINSGFQVIPGKTKHLLMDCGTEDFRSRDGGLSWQPLPHADYTYERFFMDYANPGRTYRASNHDLWVSDDEGDTWRPVWNVQGAMKQFVPIVVKASP